MPASDPSAPLSESDSNASPVAAPPPAETLASAESALEPSSSSPPTDGPAPPTEGIDESEPLTPELVEEEAIRGDFVLRWGVVLLAFLLASTRIGETVVLVHVKTGQYLASHGVLPPALDVFSYTAEDRPWTNLTWGFDLLTAGIHAVSGFAGLSIFKALIVALAFWIIARVSRPGISTWWGSICGVVALLGCHTRFSAGPDMTTILGTALALLLIHQWRESPSSKRLWLYFPLMLVWCNLDGRAWLGLAVLLLYAAGDSLGAMFKSPAALSPAARKQLWIVAGASVAATLVHPFGWKSLAAPWLTYAIEYPAFRDYIAETYLGSNLQPGGIALNFFPMTVGAFWMQLDLAAIAGLSLFVATTATLIMNRSRLDWGHTALYLGFLALAVACLHEFPVAAIVCCALATVNGQAWYAGACRQTYSIERREVLFSQGGRVLTVLTVAGIAFFGGTGRLRDAAATSAQTGYGLDRNLEMQLDDLRNQLVDDASFDHRPFHTLLTQGDQLLWVGEKAFADSRVGVYFADNDDDNLLAQHLLTRDALWPGRDRTSQTVAQAPKRSVWQKTFNKYRMTHLVVRLVARRDYDIFANILHDSANWEWTSLGAAAAVFYRNDEVDDPQLDEYVKAHAIDFRKRVYRDEQLAAAGGMEFSGRDRGIRPPTFYQRYFWTSRRPSSGDIHEALHLAVMATYPELPRHMDQSRAAMALLAIRRAQTGLARDPDDVNGYLALGQAYDFLARVEAAAVMNGSRPSRIGARYLQAVGAYNQVLVGSPDSLAAHGALMRIYAEAGKLDLALRHSEAYEQALSADPSGNAEELSNIGSQLIRLRQTMETVEDQMAQRAAMDNDPNRLSQGYFQRGCVLAALRELERPGAPLMRDLAAERFRIMMLLEAGRIEEAYDAARSFAAVAEQSGFRDWADVVALASLVYGDYGSAVERWTNAADDAEKQAFNGALLSLAPHANNFPWPLSTTASALDLLYQRPQSISASRMNAALTYLEWGRLEQARSLFHEVLASNPDTPSRPLVAYYLRELSDGKEDIDLWSPTDRIIELFAPESDGDVRESEE